jgi:hypothetical protein
LHFDLWTEEGQNLTRDGGSGSYFDADSVAYFSGIEAHNSIQFDSHDPMPRLSRFLFADWIEGSAKDPIIADGVRWSGAYRDAFAIQHRRVIVANAGIWIIEDHITGYHERAVLRWRFEPGAWTLEGTHLTSANLSIDVEGDGRPPAIRVVDARESRAYGTETWLPCLEADFDPGTRVIRSRIEVRAR